MIGVDPTVFRRYFRDEAEEIDEELADCADRRCEVKDYKMPRYVKPKVNFEVSSN